MSKLWNSIKKAFFRKGNQQDNKPKEDEQKSKGNLNQKAQRQPRSYDEIEIGDEGPQIENNFKAPKRRSRPYDEVKVDEDAVPQVEGAEKKEKKITRAPRQYEEVDVDKDQKEVTVQ